jgi:hypothetical protein
LGSRIRATLAPAVNQPQLFLLAYPVTWLLAVGAVAGLIGIVYNFYKYNCSKRKGFGTKG